MQQLYKNLHVSGQLSKDDFAVLQAAGVKVIINNRPDHEEPGQLDSSSAAQLAQAHGMTYHYLPMVNGQPLPADLVSQFKSVIEGSNDKILAHCRSGMRSAFLWALGQIGDGNISADEAIAAGQAAGIPLNNARAALEAVKN